MTWRPSRPPRAEIDPRPLGVSLERIAVRLGLASPALLSQIFARWEELVGSDVAAHARPRSLRGGVLTVAVDHPAWATSLRMLSGDLLDRLSERSGAEAGRGSGVDEVVVVVEGLGVGPARGRNRRSPEDGSGRAGGAGPR